MFSRRTGTILVASWLLVGLPAVPAQGQESADGGQAPLETRTAYTATATADTSFGYQWNNAAVANTVYPTGPNGVGCQYFEGLFSRDLLCWYSAIKFDLPADFAGSTVHSAVLQLHTAILPADWNTTYGVRALGSSWTPATFTYSSGWTWYLTPKASTDPPFQVVLPSEWDVTAIAQKWADSTWVNNGLVVYDEYQVHPYENLIRITYYESTEWEVGDRPPELVLSYTPLATTGTVYGAVVSYGEPLAGVEVWLGENIGSGSQVDHFTCTDAFGGFGFADIPAGVPLLASTGPSSSGNCDNSDFVDGFGFPLAKQWWDHASTQADATVFTVPSGGSTGIWFEPVRAPTSPPVLASPWLAGGITLDGAITGTEWSSVIPTDIALLRNASAPPSANTLTAWFGNDAEWLYGLYRLAGPIAAAGGGPDGAGIEYFWDGPVGSGDSDRGSVGETSTGVDLYGWDYLSWYHDTAAAPSGTNDVEGASTHDGTYRWYEFRKRLDSGDGYDWAITPGDRIGDASVPDAGPQLRLGSWDGASATWYYSHAAIDTTPAVVLEGTIVIVKDAVPNDPQDFGFAGDLGGFSLDDDSNPTLPRQRSFTVPPGVYGVTEIAVAGWELTGLSCDDTNSTTNLAARHVDVSLQDGETVTCTFANTKQAPPPTDETAPTVTITTPANGASYEQGASVLAAYSCADEAGGSGLASCVGTVANGAQIDTATLGGRSFTATGTDNAGNSNAVTHNYTVTSPPPPVLCNGLAPTLVGTAGSDTLTGTAGDDVILGLEGNDTINGGGGNDTICAGAGDDEIDGGLGNDWIDGEAGVDTVTYASAPAGVTVDLGVGSASGGGGSDTLVRIRHLTGSEFADKLAGNAFGNVIDGLGGDDKLKGKKGNDILLGGDGDDVLQGRQDDDALDGGPGTDTASFFVATSAVTANLQTGTATGDGTDTLTSIENANGSKQDDTLTGDGQANELIGFKGGDTLTGGGGDDVIRGKPGDDDMFGDDGDDRLLGGAGDDTADGGDGSDDFCKAEDETSCELG